MSTAAAAVSLVSMMSPSPRQLQIEIIVIDLKTQVVVVRKVDHKNSREEGTIIVADVRINTTRYLSTPANFFSSSS